MPNDVASGLWEVSTTLPLIRWVDANIVHSEASIKINELEFCVQPTVEAIDCETIWACRYQPPYGIIMGVYQIKTVTTKGTKI